jgi:hypothetical protein
VFSRLALRECLDAQPKWNPTIKLAFIDWAAGGDENVLAAVHGNKLTELVCWRDKNTMAAASRAASEIYRLGIPPHLVYADDGGLGLPINDALVAAGIPVRRVKSNDRPTNQDHYFNLAAELWFTVSQLVQQKLVILPEEETLMEQLVNRKSVLTPAGKLALERKEDMRLRGVASPDRADAACFALGIAHLTGGNYNEWTDNVLADDAQADTSPVSPALEQQGCFAGY